MPPEKKPSTLFDCINAINRKTKSYKYSKKDCSAFMLLMWFSHASDCIDFVNDVNHHLFDMPDELVYAYLYSAIPKGQRFLQYDKGIKDKELLKKQRDLVTALMDEYKMSKKEAIMILKGYLNG